jgi:hypothetical protein
MGISDISHFQQNLIAHLKRVLSNSQLILPAAFSAAASQGS